MGSGSLTRLRVAFVLLGVALLAPLLFLLRAAEARFETQRQLRHEMVAERIFDEMEAELTALLERESQRPSSAYDAADTRVSNWAPFVVGYFRRDLAGPHLLAQAQLSPERAARATNAVTTLFEGIEAPLKERWARERKLEEATETLLAEKEARQARWLILDNQANRLGKRAKSEDREALPAKPMRLKKSKRKPSPPYRSRSTDSVLAGALGSSRETPPAQAAPNKQDTAQVLKQLNRAGKKRKSARRKRPEKTRSASRPTSDDPLSGLDGL